MTLISCTNNTSDPSKEFLLKQSCIENIKSAETQLRNYENIAEGEELYMNDVIYHKKSNSCMYSYKIYRPEEQNHTHGIYDYFKNDTVFKYVENTLESADEKMRWQKAHSEKIQALLQEK